MIIPGPRLGVVTGGKIVEREHVYLHGCGQYHDNGALPQKLDPPQRTSMMSPFDIVLADDHVLVRQGIRKILQQGDECGWWPRPGMGLSLWKFWRK